MPEIEVAIGGRLFSVACDEGQQPFLRSAAKRLDAEAAGIGDQVGRLPESRMLLLAGLMLADRVSGIEDELRASQSRLARQEREIAALRDAPAPRPERIEVPVVPARIEALLAEIAARMEALADQAEERASPPDRSPRRR